MRDQSKKNIWKLNHKRTTDLAYLTQQRAGEALATTSWATVHRVGTFRNTLLR